MSKRTPKNHKKSHNTPVVLCWHEKKKLKAIRGNGYHFVHKGETFPTETIMLVVSSSGLWEACSCRSLIACQVSWISDKFWYKLLAKPKILSTSLIVPRGNVSPLCVKRYTLCPVKFWNYFGFVWPFLYINWVFALKCIENSLHA